MKHQTLLGDCLNLLPTIAPNSVQTVVTSPPYWGKRDYHNSLQHGLEPTLQDWINTQVQVFQLVKQTLRNDGTLWLNLGDTYQHKQLLGLPWKLAIALQNDGWILRSDVIWHKPNAMPETVHDRPASSYEHLFLLAKQLHYYYNPNAVREKQGLTTRRKATFRSGLYTHNSHFDNSISHDNLTPSKEGTPGTGRNLRDLWSITKEASQYQHRATFPQKLVDRCIKASIPPKGYCPHCLKPLIQSKHSSWIPSCKHHPTIQQAATIPPTVLDPYAGTGTTAAVAHLNLCNSISIELNPNYFQILSKRLNDISSQQLISDVP